MSLAKRVPPPSSPAAAKRLRSTRQRDTGAELALRSLLHGRGLRYRVDCAPVRGVRRRADVVFSGARVAVFVDGCFWHGCPEHATWPKANAEWWREKILTNKQRDADTDRRFAAAGWNVVRVWEHESPDKAADRVHETVTRALSSARQVGLVEDQAASE